MMNKKVLRNIGFSLIYLFIFMMILYWIQQLEKDADGGSIKTLFDAFWYAIVTLTTVGYGDLYPVTTQGKILGLVLILLSLGLLSYLIGTITTNFQRYMEKKKLGHYGTSFTDHIIIIGWDNCAKLTADQIVGANRPIVVITDDRNDVDLLYEMYSENELFVVFGDLSSLEALERANVGKADSVFINSDEDSEALVYLINLRKRFPNVNTVLSLNNNALKDTFYAAGATHVISDQDISTKLIASFIFEPDVAKYTEDLMSTATDEGAHDIFQFKITPGNPFLGKEYMDSFIELKKSLNAVLIGIAKWTEKGYDLVKNPDTPTIIEEKDHLILITDGNTKKKIENIFGVSEGRR